MNALARIGFAGPNEPRRALALMYRKQSHGRGLMPEHVVHAMYADYLATRSLRKTAMRFNRTRYTLMEVFRRRGLPFLSRPGYAARWMDGKEVALRYRVYREVGSLRLAAHIFGVTGPSLHDQFQKRGLAMFPRFVNARWIRRRRPTLAHAAP